MELVLIDVSGLDPNRVLTLHICGCGHTCRGRAPFGRRAPCAHKCAEKVAA